MSDNVQAGFWAGAISAVGRFCCRSRLLAIRGLSRSVRSGLLCTGPWRFFTPACQPTVPCLPAAAESKSA